jgi:membrane protein YdbS with pleckstrin-like domain
MSDHDDFAVEPVPGLPKRLPEGEAMLWQGSPDWKTFAVNVFHFRKIAIYLAILVGWQVVTAVYDGRTLAESVSRGVLFTSMSLVALAIVAGAARLYAKSCVYTITTRRLVIRHGAALPVTVNIPYALVEGVDLQPLAGGRGNIALTLKASERASLFALWPSIRPWQWRQPQPAFRCVPCAAEVARLMARAIAQTAEGEVKAVITEPAKGPAVDAFAGAATA